MFTNTLDNANRRFIVFSLFIWLPWVLIFLVRYLGPITYQSISLELSTFFISIVYVTFVAFAAGSITACLRRTGLTQDNMQIQVMEGSAFYLVRTIVIYMAVLYPIVSLFDFLIVKGASLSTIVEQREAEHLTGPRNSLIGAVGAILSGAPPVLFIMLGVAKCRKRIANFLLYIFVVLGFLSMFLSGGRNSFFISILFVVFYSVFFPIRKNKKKNSWSLSKFVSYLFVFFCIVYSLGMFLERFEAQGFDVVFMLDYLEREYNILIYRPGFEGNIFTSLYSIFIYLCFYISHAFTYLNEYFVLSYSPYMGGGYNFPQLVRLIDITLSTDFFSTGRERMILEGVYLTFPGSLYLDFGLVGAFFICIILGFTYGFLSFNLTALSLYQKLFFTYLSVAFVFSPIYGILGMANGFSLMFIILFSFFCSFKIRN